MASVPLGAATSPLPRRTSRGRLFRKYLLLILSLVTIALLASGAISIYFTYQETKASLALLQHEKALAAASRIEQYIAGIERQLAYAALPQLDASDVELRRIEFLKLLRQAPEITDICQLDPAGREQICVSRLGMDSIAAPGQGKDRSQEPAFRNAKRAQPWFSPVYFRKETEPYMTIALRSGGDSGPVIVADVNLKFIWDVVSRIKIGEKGKAYVVDGSGFLVADPDIGLVLRKTDLSQLAHVKAALGSGKDDDQTLVSTDLVGTQVLASVAPIESLHWYVFAEQPVAEVYAKLNASIARTGLLLLAGLVLSALGALALARGMVRPIRTLEEGAERIGSGNLDQNIEVHTGDELEALANRFNRMTAQLKESYAGLERKVEERTSELQNSLDQQRASAEVLGAISGSISDTKPVFDVILHSCQRLFDGHVVGLMLVREDGLLDIGAYEGAGNEWLRDTFPTPIMRDSGSGLAILEKRVVHFSDIEADEVPRMAREGGRKMGMRSSMFAPLLSEGRAIGSLWVGRPRAGGFSEKQMALLKTFADQAVIAIQNARLVNETKEGLEQQTAIAEILRVISSSPGDVTPMLNAVAERAMKLCDAAQSTIVLVAGDVLRCAASVGSTGHMQEGEEMPITRGSVAGRAIVDGMSVQIEDLATAPEDEFPIGRELQRRIGHHTALAVPLMRENRAIGSIQLWRMEKRAFTDKQIALVKTFADQAAIAIENVRLFNETKEALERQTAIAEILRVISSSHTDVVPVLDAIAERAARLCDASAASMYLIEGNALRHLASKGPSPDPVSHVDTLPINRDSITGRAVLEQETIQVPDLLAEAAEYPLSRDIAKRFGHRTVVVVPLLREGRAFGAILLRRQEVRPFNEREIALLRTFGDQAAIAIENVRLFNETKEALEQQRASGEVLATISSSIADTSPVFERILESCERLFEGTVIAIETLDPDGILRIAKFRGSGRPDMAQYVVGPVLPGASISANAILSRSIQHIPDLALDNTAPERSRRAYVDIDVSAVIVAPMLWEGNGIGCISVGRDRVGAFSDKEVALLKTFADQAVIAIQNARLFNETKEALEQQQASGEVLSAISSSIADVRPVFERILESCKRLFAGSGVSVNVVGEDGLLRTVAQTPGLDTEELLREAVPLDSRSATGVCIAERRVLHFPDVQNDQTVPPITRAHSNVTKAGALIFAPMLWEGKGIGSIAVGRERPGPFSEKEIALLKTFADQAVIAIQNARLFREIQDKSAQLEVANKHKSEFLANMSHELRTPLNAIIGFSEVLMERLFGEVNDKQADYLNDIHSSGKHLLTLINDILDLSKVEAGRMELEVSTFDLASAVSNAMTLVRERAQRHGIALGQQVDAKLDNITADERKFKQILLNLLSNAVKFTPDGGRIDVSAQREDGNAVIAVHDTGIGIAQEDQAAVFEEFRQVGRDYTKKQEGTGLGLTLTKKFVELHGGRIWLESEPGKGSTFTFTIPLQR